jgi:hypothetical protein
MSDKLTLFDKIQKSLFSDTDEHLDGLSAHDLEIRKRYMSAFTVWLENPTYTDKQIANHLKVAFKIENSQAYRDIGNLRIMLGNVRNAGKEWHRFTVIQMAKDAYALAVKQHDAKAMAVAAGVYGKYTRCDQIEADQMPWDSIIPPDFEPSPDITILGFKRDPNVEKKREKLRKKYMQFTEDAILDDVIDNGNSQ